MTDALRQRIEDLISGGVLAVGDGYRAKNDELSQAGLPFARAANINSGFHFEDAARFPVDELRRVGDKISRPGDVVFTSKGTVGRFAYVGDDTERFVLSPQLCYWRSLDASRIDPRFLYYWLSGPDFFGQYMSVKGQTDMADYVSLRDQRRMSMTLPPIGTQRAIAGVLGALDDKIALNRRMNETLAGLAVAHFDQRYWRSAKRGTWVRQALGEHLEVVRGLSYTGAGLTPDGLPLHNLNSIFEGGGYKRAGIKRYSGDFKVRHVVNAGDVLVANTEQGFEFLLIGFSAIVPARFGDTGLFSHHLYRVRPRPGSPLTTRLIYLLLLQGPLRAEIAGYANGTTVNMLPMDALQKPLFRVPPADVAAQIDGFVAPLFERAEAAEDESETLAELRDALLPKLISGELRVRDAEAAAEAAGT